MFTYTTGICYLTSTIAFSVTWGSNWVGRSTKTPSFLAGNQQVCVRVRVRVCTVMNIDIRTVLTIWREPPFVVANEILDHLLFWGKE
jgi:hypothetical protein